MVGRASGRHELKRHSDWNEGGTEPELNLKLHRLATNKIAGISEGTAAYLDGFF